MSGIERRSPFSVAAIAGTLVGLFLAPSQASAQARQRPISDFVEAQGTYCIPDTNRPGECFLFVPPVQNFLGFTDPDRQLGISIDYAGLVDDVLGGELGTSFRGTVTEIPLRDGRCLVKVVLHTENASTFVIPRPPGVSNPFGNQPLLFGARATDLLEDETPALARSILKVEFINTTCGAPLPDLLQLLRAPQPGQELLRIQLVATAEGLFADGTPGRVHVTQVGLLDTKANPNSAAADFPVERITLIPTRRGGLEGRSRVGVAGMRSHPGRLRRENRISSPTPGPCFGIGAGTIISRGGHES